jgi:uncharacterized protein YkwD
MCKPLILFWLLLSLTQPCRAEDFYIRTIETDMVAMINEIRAAYELAPLTQNFEATRVARYKSEEMQRLGYAGHYSPVYGSPADMLSRFKIPFETVGENIAAGDARPWEVVYEWLSRPAYNANILCAGYRELGVGYIRDAENSNSYWVLLFIS